MSNSKLYEKIVLKNNQKKQVDPESRTYKGFSTISNKTASFSLFDIELIKQDLLNHFNTRKGERLENPSFGTIIWDVIFDPLTDSVKAEIVKDVETIINYDPRIVSSEILINEYEHGLTIECQLTYLPYYVNEAIKFRFDQENGLNVD